MKRLAIQHFTANSFAGEAPREQLDFFWNSPTRRKEPVTPTAGDLELKKT